VLSISEERNDRGSFVWSDGGAYRSEHLGLGNSYHQKSRSLNTLAMAQPFVASLHRHAGPLMQIKLNQDAYALTVAHAALGAITAIAAMCVLLAAGASALPEKFGVNKYRLWMRRVQELWWVVLFLAFASFARLYVRDLFRK